MKIDGQRQNTGEIETEVSQAPNNGSGVESNHESQNLVISRSDSRRSADNKTGSSSHARRATGPRTPIGKERSKHNALKHGLFSNIVLLESEPRSQFNSLLKGFREDRQPKGTLEEFLVEKLGTLAWRYRRLIIAEVAEIRSGGEFLEWDKEQRQEEEAEGVSHLQINYGGGQIRRIANPIILQKCLELLEDLEMSIKKNGFVPASDKKILTELYGQYDQIHWGRTLFVSYELWRYAVDLPEEERQQKGFSPVEHCVAFFHEQIGQEKRRLARYKRARASIESERMRLEVLRRNVPDAAQLDRLLRCESNLERNFDRTLSQLERLQRMRKGQPVLPKLEVYHSLS